MFCVFLNLESIWDRSPLEESSKTALAGIGSKEKKHLYSLKCFCFFQGDQRWLGTAGGLERDPGSNAVLPGSQRCLQNALGRVCRRATGRQKWFLCSTSRCFQCLQLVLHNKVIFGFRKGPLSGFLQSWTICSTC